MLIKLSSWLCLEIRMQDEATVKRLIIVPLKWLKSSNIWEQFQQIKVIFRKKLEQIEVRECLLSFGAEFLSSSLLSKN